MGNIRVVARLCHHHHSTPVDAICATAVAAVAAAASLLSTTFARITLAGSGSVSPTDNEGLHIWPKLGGMIDTVNIMAYDAGILKFNFTTMRCTDVGVSRSPLCEVLPPCR